MCLCTCHPASGQQMETPSSSASAGVCLTWGIPPYCQTVQLYASKFVMSSMQLSGHVPVETNCGKPYV